MLVSRPTVDNQWVTGVPMSGVPQGPSSVLGWGSRVQAEAGGVPARGLAPTASAERLGLSCYSDHLTDLNLGPHMGGGGPVAFASG